VAKLLLRCTLRLAASLSAMQASAPIGPAPASATAPPNAHAHPPPRYAEQRRPAVPAPGAFAQQQYTCADDGGACTCCAPRLEMQELFEAAARGDEAAVRLMLEAGDDCGRADEEDFTPLFVAAQFGHAAVAGVLAEEAGVDLNRADRKGTTPLFIASQNGHGAAVSALLHAGAELARARLDQVTPLYIAATNGHAEVVQALAEAGADLQHASSDGRTALFQAVKNGHDAVVRVLIAAGADVNQGPAGWLPLGLALRCQHRGIVAMLQTAGAHT
jgi:ankyrin repeat protein